MRKLLVCLLFLLGVLVLPAGQAGAQPSTVSACPRVGTCTVFIWVNGVLGKDPASWQREVQGYGEQFFATHPNLDRTYVQFYPVFNQSAGRFTTWFGNLIGQGDLGESIDFLDLQEVAQSLADSSPNFAQHPKAHQLFMTGVLQFQEDQITGDPDLALLHQTVQDWWDKGYRVVLVGHSEGNLYNNLEYLDRLLNADGKGKKLPDSNQLAIIAIATPSSTVPDGRRMYTTQCNDFIYYAPSKFQGVKGALPWNVSNGFSSCFYASVANFFSKPLTVFFAVGDLIAQGFSLLGHELSAYLATGSATQKQIYRQMEDSLPDPGCGDDVNCYLKDDFSGGGYTDNFTQLVANGSETGEAGGALWLDSSGASARSILRTRRVFTGPFTLSFEFRISGMNDVTIGLFNALDDLGVVALQFSSKGVRSYPAAPLSSFDLSVWHTMTFTKTDSLVTLFVDGKRLTTNSSTQMAGYYGAFDLKKNNNLQVQNLSVVRGVTSPLPRPLPTGTVKVTVSGYRGSVTCALNGVSVTAPATLSKQPTGNKALSCSAPAGYKVTSVSPASQNLATGKTVNFVVSLTAVPPFSISCSFATSPARVKKSNRVTITQKNGTAPIKFIANGKSLGTGKTLNITPDRTGTATVQVTATDAKGKKANSSCKVKVVK